MNGIYPRAIQDLPSHPDLVTAAVLCLQNSALRMQACHLGRIILTMYRAPTVRPDIEPVLIPPAVDRVVVRGADRLEPIEVLRDIALGALNRRGDLLVRRALPGLDPGQKHFPGSCVSGAGGISGDVLKYLKGLGLVISKSYAAPCPGASQVALTGPGNQIPYRADYQRSYQASIYSPR